MKIANIFLISVIVMMAFPFIVSSGDVEKEEDNKKAEGGEDKVSATTEFNNGASLSGAQLNTHCRDMQTEDSISCSLASDQDEFEMKNDQIKNLKPSDRKDETYVVSEREQTLPDEDKATGSSIEANLDTTSFEKTGFSERTHDSDSGDKTVDTVTKESEDGVDSVSKLSEGGDIPTMDSENGKETATPSTKKQRYFPLLYTFSSFFTSFLTEFGEVSSPAEAGSVNSTDDTETVKNFTSPGDYLSQNLNSSSNSTEQGKRTRFQCSLVLKNSANETVNVTSEVKIINSTELLEILNFSKSQKSSASTCVLVMFYTRWCHFSAQTAPEYNALARAFPQLDVLAVDTSHFSYLNAKFGTVAVPNIMLFHSRSAVRFNHTTRDLEHFAQFVSNNTGLEADASITVLAQDYEGPLSSQVEQGRDWLLWLAWAFILVCSTYGFFFSVYGQAVMARLRVLWQEHQHIE